MSMNTIHSGNLKAKKDECVAEGKDCGCSNGMCPGTMLAGLILAGWGIYALGVWVWGILVG